MSQNHEGQTAAGRLRQTLKGFETLLARWNGGLVELRELTIGHKTLTLRLTRADSAGYLEVHCIGPSRIWGDVRWSPVQLQVLHELNHDWIVMDRDKHFHVICDKVEVKEHLNG